MAPVKGHITIDKTRCKACTFCIDFCPQGCIELSDELNLKGYFVARFKDEGQGDAPDDAEDRGHDGNGCNGCGTCALMCPEVAIEVVRG